MPESIGYHADLIITAYRQRKTINMVRETLSLNKILTATMRFCPGLTRRTTTMPTGSVSIKTVMPRYWLSCAHAQGRLSRHTGSVALSICIVDCVEAHVPGRSLGRFLELSSNRTASRLNSAVKLLRFVIEHLLGFLTPFSVSIKPGLTQCVVFD